MAWFAWNAAKKTLSASVAASKAAKTSAEAAEAANEQARLDSIKQTRPYVYVELIPGLRGGYSYDIRIKNVGKSAARDLTLKYDAWSSEPDEIEDALQELFATPRTLPPDCQIRSIWSVHSIAFDYKPVVEGIQSQGTISVRYTTDDPSRPSYTDQFEVLLEKSGIWPFADSGPESPGGGLSSNERAFYQLGQALVSRVSELGR